MIEQSTPELPPLPYTRLRFNVEIDHAGERLDYTAGQMRSYGASCYAAGVAAGMEKAAKICRE